MGNVWDKPFPIGVAWRSSWLAPGNFDGKVEDEANVPISNDTLASDRDEAWIRRRVLSFAVERVRLGGVTQSAPTSRFTDER